MTYQRGPQIVAHQEAGPTGPLSDAERSRFAVLEEQIRRGRDAWYELGRALWEIRSGGRLYRETHATWQEYVRDRWGFSRRHADRLMIGAANAEIAQRQLSAGPDKRGPIGPLVTIKTASASSGAGIGENTVVQPIINEAQARELSRVRAEQIPAVVVRALALAGDGELTAKFIAVAAREARRATAGSASTGRGAHLLEAAQADFRDLLTQVRALRHALGVLAGRPHGACLRQSLTSTELGDRVREPLRLLREAVEQATPESECLACGGRGGDCRTCDGLGWLPKGAKQ